VTLEATTDRRRERHDAKRATIVDEAWKLAWRDGLAAISLRDLAAQVDLRQPSLYAYFDSKLALYDAMFADGNRQLIAMATALPERDDPSEALVELVEALIRFSTEDPVRHQLLFHRPVPGFEPSPESYALAQQFYELAGARVAAAGANTPDDFDLFTALVSGLSHQQVANDPGGDRWVLLSRRAVEMYLADLDRRTTTETKAKAATKTKATRPRKATR
jgi:AcrR family transcriptional regulator